MEKELNRMLEDLIKELIKFIGNIFKSLFYGIKKLNKLPNVVVLLGTFIFSLLGYLAKSYIFNLNVSTYMRYIIYYLFLFLPCIYLIILGNSHDKNLEKYKKIFKEIGFKGRDGKYPIFIGLREDGKKIIYTFKSNIPLREWKDTKERLETGLDCNILLFKSGKNKKFIELTTVPSDYQIPIMIKWSDKYIDSKESVLTIGQGLLEIIKFDLSKNPHVLIGGETGSGKSVILKMCLWQMAKRGSKIYMIDFKGGVEFGKKFERFGEVITDRLRVIEMFKELIEENNRRLALFRETEVENLGEYNAKTGENLCRIGVFCDEIGEMLDKRGCSKKEREILEQIEGLISSLARLSRAPGIHLILGVQRPDANVVTGQIKTNIPVRISGRFADKPASEIILGNTMAVDLPDIKGRFLYRLGNEIIEFQAFYFDKNMMLNENEDLSSNSKEGQETVLKKPGINFLSWVNKKRLKPKNERKPKAAQKQCSTNTSMYDDSEIELLNDTVSWSVDENKKEGKEGIELDFDYSDQF